MNPEQRVARCAGNRKLLRKLFDYSVQASDFHLSAVILNQVGDGYQRSADLEFVTRALAPALQPRADFFGPLDSRCFRIDREISRFTSTSDDVQEAERFFSSGFGFISVAVAYNCWIDHRLEKPTPKIVILATEKKVYVISAGACIPLLRMVLTSIQWIKVFEKKNRKATWYILRRWLGMNRLFEPILVVEDVNEIDGLKLCRAEGGSFWPEKVSELTLTQLHYLTVYGWKGLRNSRDHKVLSSVGLEGKQVVWGSFDTV